MFDVPNLDCLSTEPDDYATAANVLQELAQYCKLKREAMRCRLDGLITSALAMEREMEKTYKLLPEWTRW